ncbi:MFS transporter [Pseudomonas kurunegalensis]|uniref:MFS transporter n=1 Tax=Pseudomonas kurunegalensis TaxID=485880 RepID=UPI002570A8CC|nr:MFS transporter [Pseudomonas kurunegalensis]WJD60708.1 MFS transporter [Pseudomonas kurunegalensis]
MQTTTTAHGHSAEESLPMAGLLALAMTGFIAILTETLPAGLLVQMSHGLSISQSLAGQTITAYAIGSLLAAIPLTIATQGWRRRRVLLMAIGGFLVFNTITAVSQNYWLTLGARFFAGMAAGLAWSLLAGYARRMVAPHQQGRAIAVSLVGTPIALSLGLPLGTWLGSLVGWRSAFGIMSLMTIVLICWVVMKVPDFPGQAKGERMQLKRVMLTPGVRPVLLVVMIWMLAHNMLYTYVAPFVDPAGLTERVDLVLFVFGVSALVSIWITGRVVDRYLRGAVLTSLVAFVVASLLFALWPTSAAMVLVAVAIWGLSFGGAGTLVQTALADTAGKGADVAIAINVVGWNGAIAGGGILGGLLLNGGGLSFFPWVLIGLLILAILIVWSAKRRGFPPGSRLSSNN